MSRFRNHTPSENLDRGDAVPTAGGWGVTSAPPVWAIVAVGLLSLTALVAGCGIPAGGAAGGTAGVLARLRPLVAACHGPLNGYVGWDLSGSARRTPSLTPSRLQTLQNVADQVAACTGYLRVVGFSATITDTTVLGEAEFPNSSATEAARILQANRTVTALIASAVKALPSAMDAVSPNGTDVLSQLTLAAQFQAQRTSGTLDLVLLTDGIATTGPVMMNTTSFTDRVARSAATLVPVPNLSGAAVRFIGIGRVAGPGSAQPPSWYTAALTDFYSAACARTRAHCLVTTDYTPGG